MKADHPNRWLGSKRFDPVLCACAGIDTTNIMQGGRRARRAAAPTVDYRTLQGSSDSEDDQDSGSDHDSGSDSDAAPSDRGKGAKRQSEVAACGAAQHRALHAP